MIEVDVVEIGKRVRASREAKGLSRKALADLTGIPYRTMENFELGSQEPSVSRMRTLAEALGVTEGFLIDGKSDANPEKTPPWEDESETPEDTGPEPNTLKSVRSQLATLDEERAKGFGTNIEAVALLLDGLSADLERLSADNLSALIDERNLFEDAEGWLLGISEIMEDEPEEAISACEGMASRIIDTAVFGADLCALTNDALTELGEGVGMRFGMDMGFVNFGLDDSDRDHAIGLLRPALRNLALAGNGPDMEDGSLYPIQDAAMNEAT